MKTRPIKARMLTVLLSLCMMLSLIPAPVSAAGINYIDKVRVTYNHTDYKAGDVPQASATVTEGKCSVAYEYWREIYQKEEGGVWSGTGRYWYSDPDKMASLAADKQITKFEAGHHYSYNIVLVTDSGYFFSDDETTVSVGEYEWGTPGNHTNLAIKEMSTKLYIYSPYSIDIPEESTDEIVDTVDIGNVWKNLDSSQPLAFTAEVNPNNSACSGKVEIVEEAWEKSTAGESTPITDIIKSTDTPRNPIAGGEYWYSVILKAKDGYRFSDNVTFICDGQTYTSNTAVSDNGKTFTAWEFLPPVTVSDRAGDTVIKDIEVTGATLSYNAGDTPKATAKVSGNTASNCVVKYEEWSEYEQTDNGIQPTGRHWYSDENRFSFNEKFTSFEAGKIYYYDIVLEAQNGRTFASEGVSLQVNGTTAKVSEILGQGTLLFADRIVTIKPTTPVESKEIGDVDIEGVTFNYEPGDTPKATAYKCDPWDEQYDIEYEYWEEMETNANGESVPVKYWYSDENKNNALAQGQKITTFEEGKTYMYSISLKARAGNTFAANSKVMVNGTNVNHVNVTNTGTGLFIVAVRTIKPQTVQLQNISLVEINNATISFKVGDKPVFTGNTPANVPYIYQSEFWSTDGGKKYYYSADFWNDNNPDDLFTEFESGKTYTYGIYFKAKEGYCFTTDTKLKINGKYYGYDITDYDPMLQYPNGGYATMWVDTDLTMTPQAIGTTPEYKITGGANSSWKQNSNCTLKFVANGDFSKFTGVKMDGTLVAADKYTAVSGSTVITLKKDYLSTLSVGRHILTIVYNDGECSTEFEIRAADTTSSINNPGNNPGSTSSKVSTPDTSETTSPKTGDTNNMLWWFIVLLVSGSVTIGTMMVHRKKKYNR